MRVTSITAEPIHGRVKPELAIISALGAHVVGQYVLVRIADDAGHVGLGEASVTAVWSGETQSGAIALIHEQLAPLVIGGDPFDVAWLSRRMDQAVHGNSFAKAAVEMAVLDLQGQALGMPVHRLLGGTNLPPLTKRGPGGVVVEKGIRLKFVIGAVEPELAAERARCMTDAGWSAIKVKVARHGDPQPDLDRLRAVRAAIGPHTWLSIDANGGYSVDRAVWLARRLEALDIALFEQPTRRGDHRAMARVRRQSPVPIMADESVFTPLDAHEVIRHEAADVLSIYPGKHGGLRATQQIAGIAEAAGIPCTIGSNLEREVATAAMAHVVLATPNVDCERYPGDLIGPLYFEEKLLGATLRYEGDRLWAPEGAGLGVH